MATLLADHAATARRSVRGLCSLAMCLVLASGAEAQLAPPTDACTKAATQFQLNQCASAAMKLADSTLSRTYTRVLALSDSVRRPLLRESQRAWLNFRGTHCRYEAAEYEGGTMFPMVYANCLESLTNQREVQLRAAIKIK